MHQRGRTVNSFRRGFRAMQPIILLGLCRLLLLPTLSQSQTTGWVQLENAPGDIRSLDVGPDGRIYVLEYSGEAIEEPNLSFSLPLCNLHLSSNQGGTFEQVAEGLAAIPPIFLPGGDVLVSFYGVWTYPDWAYYWIYPDYLDPEHRRGEFSSIWYDRPECLSTSQSSVGLFALASRFTGSSWGDDNGLVWIHDADSGTDRRLRRMGGVRGAAVSEEGIVYFAEAERTDYGIINVFFCSTGDRGRTVDTLYDRLLVEQFVLTPDNVLLAEAGPYDPDSIAETASDRSVYRSGDGGRSWEVVLPGVNGMLFRVVDNIYYLISLTSDSTPIYQPALYISTDQGATWTERYRFAEGGISNFQVTDEGAFFVLQRGVVRGSSDTGKSWVSLPGPVPFSQYIVMPEGEILAHAGKQGIYRLAYPLTVPGQEPELDNVDLDLW